MIRIQSILLSVALVLAGGVACRAAEPSAKPIAITNVRQSTQQLLGEHVLRARILAENLDSNLGQVAGLLTMLSDVARRDGSQLVLFAGIDQARFKRQVFPGDTLMLEAQLERAVRGVGRFHTRATVGEQLVCEAQLLAAIRDVPPVPELPV